MSAPFRDWHDKAFKLHRFDVVVKLGGSVAYGQHTEEISQALARASESTRCLVFPGGGQPDELFEQLMDDGRLDGPTLTQVTNLALDQTAHLVAGWGDHLAVTTSVLDASAIIGAGRVPVLAPAALLAANDVFRDTNRVSSDSMAAWVAQLLRIPRLTLVKSRHPGSSEPREWFTDGFVDEVFADLAASAELEVSVAVVGCGDDVAGTIGPPGTPRRWRPAR